MQLFSGELVFYLDERRGIRVYVGASTRQLARRHEEGTNINYYCTGLLL